MTAILSQPQGLTYFLRKGRVVLSHVINTQAADALVTCVAKALAAMLLT